MKKSILFISILFLATCFYSQSPDKINYQAVVRSVVGNVITNTSVPVTLTITDGINSYVQGPTNLTTNNYGLLNIEIGPIVGSPSAIDWSSGSVQIISDINGVSGTSDLLSVPYALHANSVEGYPTTGISNGYILVWDSNSNSWVAQANSASTDDQNLSGATLTGTSLQIDIEDGASTTVDLAGLQDGTGTDDQNISGSGLSGTDLTIGIEGGTSETVDLSSLQDGTGTDDQNLSGATLTGTSLQIDIEDGASTTVDLAGLQDGTGTDDQNITGSGLTGTTLTIGIENGANEIINLSSLVDDADADPTNEIELPASANANDVLTWNGTAWVAQASASDADWAIDGSGNMSNANIGEVSIGVDATVNSVTVGRGGGNIGTNTAIGTNALSSNTTGLDNTANGNGALRDNTTGYQNTANGHVALSNNTTGYQNTANGAYALTFNTTGYWNTANGRSALYKNTTGNSNTAIGRNALYENTTGNYNTANGRSALYTNTTGSANTANGYLSLYENTTGNYNTAIGRTALYKNTTGYSNVAVGVRALYHNTDKSNLVAIGDSALYNNGVGALTSFQAISNTAIGSKALYSNTTGSWNTANGSDVLKDNISGYSNTAIGTVALSLNTSGIQNTAIGTAALRDNNGSNNIALGFRAGDNMTSGNNNIIIGYDIDAPVGTGSNQMSIGNLIYGTGLDGTGSTISSGNVGIGTTTPSSKLHISGGDLRLDDTYSFVFANTTSSNNAGMVMQNAGVNTSWVFWQGSTGNLAFANNTSGTTQMALNSQGNLGIGTSGPTARLEVKGAGNTSTTNSFFVENSSGTDIFTIRDDVRLSIGTTPSSIYQLYNYVPSTSTVDYAQRNYFYRNSTATSGSMYGTYSDTRRGSAASSGAVYGVYSYSYNNVGSGSTYALRGYASGASTGAKYGIYCSTAGSGTHYAGYFSGDVYCSGSYLPSDESLKRNISDYDNALDQLSSIEVKEYEYKHEGDMSKMDLPKGRQVGIMAQNIESVFPQLTKESEFDLNDDPENEDPDRKENILKFKAVNYTGMVPVLVKATQEQQAIIDSQENRIDQQNERIEKLEQQLNEIKALVQK